MPVNDDEVYCEEELEIANLLKIEPDLVWYLRVPLYGSIKIWYRDFEGNTSERVIHPETVDLTYLIGFCERAKAQRTFRLDRILSFFVADTVNSGRSLFDLLCTERLDRARLSESLEEATKSLSKVQEKGLRTIRGDKELVIDDSGDYHKLETTHLKATFTANDGRKTRCEIKFNFYAPLRRKLLTQLREMHLTSENQVVVDFDQLSQITDQDTGGTVVDLAKYLEEKWEQSPLYLVNKLWLEKSNVLNAVLFVGKRSVFTKKRKQIIYSLLPQLIDDSLISEHLHPFLFESKKPSNALSTFRKYFNNAVLKGEVSNQNDFAGALLDIANARQSDLPILEEAKVFLRTKMSSAQF
ncbi:WYL domain-containing protein [Pseudomonadales bacterium]|nr:WYL domain-containing protein [Pseudomonadales bacterium]